MAIIKKQKLNSSRNFIPAVFIIGGFLWITFSLYILEIPQLSIYGMLLMLPGLFFVKENWMRLILINVIYVAIWTPYFAKPYLIMDIINIITNQPTLENLGWGTFTIYGIISFHGTIAVPLSILNIIFLSIYLRKKRITLLRKIISIITIFFSICYLSFIVKFYYFS